MYSAVRRKVSSGIQVISVSRKRQTWKLPAGLPGRVVAFAGLPGRFQIDASGLFLFIILCVGQWNDHGGT